MNIGIIRCEKNADRCPLTACIKAVSGGVQGFSGYENPQLIGVFACKCPGDNVNSLGKILKKKGAEAIHFCTCAFSRKQNGKWELGNGFCDHVDSILKTLSDETGIPCIKGTAHLPDGYQPQEF